MKCPKCFEYGLGCTCNDGLAKQRVDYALNLVSNPYHNAQSINNIITTPGMIDNYLKNKEYKKEDKKRQWFTCFKS